MVLIARAMAVEPQVLILDEPESNLDFRNQLLVMDTLSELASAGMTCVFNTHYPAHAQQQGPGNTCSATNPALSRKQILSTPSA